MMMASLIDRSLARIGLMRLSANPVISYDIAYHSPTDWTTPRDSRSSVHVDLRLRNLQPITGWLHPTPERAQ